MYVYMCIYSFCFDCTKTKIGMIKMHRFSHDEVMQDCEVSHNVLFHLYELPMVVVAVARERRCLQHLVCAQFP